MATVDADICNLALSRIGQKEFISTLNDPSVQAIACNVVYATTRDAVLAEYDWGFATKRLPNMAPLPTARSGWTYMYALPSDFIAMQRVWNGLRPGAGSSGVASASAVASGAIAYGLPLNFAFGPKTAFTVELSDDGSSQVLLTDQPTAEIIYTARPAAGVVTSYSPLFVQALAWALAMELSYSLPVKPSLAAQFAQLYKAAILKAAAADMRGKQDDTQPDSEFIAVRG